MKPYLLLPFLLFISAPALAQLSAAKINDILKEAVESKRSKSIIVGIIDSNGRTTFSHGVLSDKDTRQPNANTLYEIGSITKVFTSLVLAEKSLKGHLKLEDPISKFIPNTVHTPTNNGREITLLDLSIHTSTLPRFPFNVDSKDPDNPYVDYKINHIYEYINTYKPDIEIGSKWRYSNTAYGLLGHILTEQAGAKSYESLILGQISKKLNLPATLINPTTVISENMAVGHTENGSPIKPVDLAGIEGGGGLRSNVTDLLTFAASNMGMIRSDLFPAMELTHIKRIKKNADGNEYSTMGWTLWENGGREIIFKDGGMPGFRSFIGFDKKNKVGVVVLSNSNNGVTDIGKHFLDPTSPLSKYAYKWSLIDTLRSTANKHGVPTAIHLYNTLKLAKDPSFNFDENQLNYLGLEYSRNKRSADAAKIFELNALEYPNSVLVYDSLGELYKRMGNKKKAVKNFEKARQLEPGNEHWTYMIKVLSSKF